MNRLYEPYKGIQTNVTLVIRILTLEHNHINLQSKTIIGVLV